MKCSWITFCDKKYETLALVLVDGLSAFSIHPVEVFGLGYMPDIRLPSVTCREIQKEDGDHFWPYSAKIKAAVQSSCEVGVLFDADVVPNVHVDQLMQFSIEHCDMDYPLCSAHPRDPKHQDEFMKILGVKEPTMDYVQANFLFSAASKPFLAEVLNKMKWVGDRAKTMYNFDETLLNVMLWKHGATKQMHPFIPTAENFEEYWDSPETYQGGYYENKWPTFHAFHGEKNAEKAAKMLERLQHQKDSTHPIRMRAPAFL